MSGYAKNARAVFPLRFQLVWCPKYRRPVLEGKVRQRLMALLREKAAEIEMTIHAMEVMPEHARLVMETDPRWCGAEIPARLKGSTSHVLRDEFPAVQTAYPVHREPPGDVDAPGL